MECEGCEHGRPGRPLTGKKEEEVGIKEAAIQAVAKITRTAHGFADNTVVAHCPFCGSGQVINRSTGDIECGFCHMAFTVLIQPVQPMMPQTVDGQPYDPTTGQPTQGTDASGLPDPNNLQPEEAGTDDDGSFGGEPLSEKTPDDDKAGDQGEDEGAREEGDDDPLKGIDKDSALFITAQGIPLPYDQYTAHLALQFSPDRSSTLREVQASNRRG